MIDVCRMLCNFRTLISKYIKIRHKKFFNENMNNIKSIPVPQSTATATSIHINSESVSSQREKKNCKKKKHLDR